MTKQVRDWQEDMEMCEEMLMNNTHWTPIVTPEVASLYPEEETK